MEAPSVVVVIAHVRYGPHHQVARHGGDSIDWWTPTGCPVVRVLTDDRSVRRSQTNRKCEGADQKDAYEAAVAK
jgi:hypothetical protein